MRKVLFLASFLLLVGVGIGIIVYLKTVSRSSSSHPNSTLSPSVSGKEIVLDYIRKRTPQLWEKALERREAGSGQDPERRKKWEDQKQQMISNAVDQYNQLLNTHFSEKERAELGEIMGDKTVARFLETEGTAIQAEEHPFDVEKIPEARLAAIADLSASLQTINDVARSKVTSKAEIEKMSAEQEAFVKHAMETLKKAQKNPETLSSSEKEGMYFFTYGLRGADFAVRDQSPEEIRHLASKLKNPLLIKALALESRWAQDLMNGGMHPTL